MDTDVLLEALYEAVHAVGCRPEDSETLVRYLQEIDFPDNNASMLVQVKEREAPRVCLRVSVVEAKGLTPSDPNGLSDPFCALYVGSSPGQKQLTSYKTETLNPTWNETFLVQLQNAAEDVLHVEVWDFDPEETTREKIKKITEVKGIKGIKMLMKEVAHSNKQQNDFTGMAKVALKDVPAKGVSVWCDIEKEGKLKKQGEVRLQLSYVFDSNCEVPYRKLVRKVLQHELHNFKVDGKLSNLAEMLLEQHRVQHNMEPHSDAVVRWAELVDIHLEHPLNVGLFVPMVVKLVLCLRDGILNNEQQTIFLEVGTRLLQQCLSDVRKVHMNITDPSLFSTVSHLLSITSQLAAVSHLQEGNDIVAAISDGVSDWFTNLLEKYPMGDDKTSLDHLISITEHIITYWEATSKYDELYQQHFQISYSNIVYKLLSNKLVEVLHPIVVPLCKSLTTSRLPVDSLKDIEGSGPLFQLYLALCKLFGSAVSQYGADPELVLHQEHLQKWFYPGALHWIIVSFHKSFYAVRNAVNLDRLERVDENSVITGSVLDVLHIFQQVKVFWEQLAWTEAEMAFVFVVNIINDLCDCSVLYIEELCEKVEGQRTKNGAPYNVAKELCFAANNIHHLMNMLPQTIQEFRADEVAERLDNNNSVNICQQTLKLITTNAVEIISNKNNELFSRTAKKVAAALVKQFPSEDVILEYLDSNLHTLHEHLNSENFTDILSHMWSNVLNSFHEHVKTAVTLSKDTAYFKSCLKILKGTTEYFKNLDGKLEPQLAEQLEQLLILNSMDTNELIHQYYKEELAHQKMEISPECGLLTVRLQFDDDTLRIEILNARNLQLSGNGSACDPYVKVSLQPRHVFQHTWVTKVHKKTVYPLFDELFEIKLSTQQRYMKDGLIVFELKDKHYVCADKLLGEAFVSFREIPETDTHLEYLEQIHLHLSCPSSLDTDAFAALVNRQDKDAKDFVRRRRKLVQTPKTVISDKT